MGRGRLRRGYSLEVIFEEDPDFCSHLDSLDSVAHRTGVRAHDEISVDSLFEDYHLVCRAAGNDHQVFRSLDGLIDLRQHEYNYIAYDYLYRGMESCFVEWDEFTTDSLGKIERRAENMLPPTSSLIGANIPDHEIPPSGRRSRVSRRQIVEASWILDSSDSSNDNDSTGPDNDIFSDHSHTGRSLVTSVADFNQETQLPIYSMQIPVQNPPQLPPAFARICNTSDKDTLDSYVSAMTDDTDTNTYAFADPYDDVTSVASSTFDSSGSTASTGSSSNGSVCTVNGVNKRDLNLTPTNLSTSENLHGSITSITISNASPTLVQDSDSLSTDVKKVRALFEISNRKGAHDDYPDSYCSINTTLSRSSSNLVKNPHNTSCSSISSGSNSSSPSGVAKKLKQNVKNHTSIHNDGNIYTKSNSGGSSPNGKLRSAYSQFSLNHLHERRLDFVDLLVNDNVVIEDSPDLFQTLRNRHRDNPASKGSSSSSCSNSSTNTNMTATTAHTAGLSSCNSTLRRSKSMGAGISKIGDDSSSASSSSENINGLRRSCILAAEMPAPDTVKNVRTVFEKMLVSRSKGSKKNATAAEGTDTIDGSMMMSGVSFLDKSSMDISCNSYGFKKSLSSVKSNPTSKIFRSESMRIDNNDSTLGRRYGKPVLLKDSSPTSTLSRSTGTSPPTKTYEKPLCINSNNSSSTPSLEAERRSAVKKLVERKLSEPIKFNPKLGCGTTNGFRPREGSLSEEELSLLCSLTDDSQPKFVPPDVLQRIRSCGTTTTYFGGQIVAKTVKNRKLAVTRRHTVDFQDYYSSTGSYSSTTNTFLHGESSASNYASSSATPTNLYHNELLDSPNYYGPTGFSACENFSLASISPAASVTSSSALLNNANITVRSSSNSSSSTNTTTNTTAKAGGLQQDYRTAFHLPLESIYSAAAAAMMKADSAPRIISVLPKSQSSSPTKSSSPAGSIIEGRNSPEGCESHNDNCHTRSEWINEIPLSKSTSEVVIEKPVNINNNVSPTPPPSSPHQEKQDGNNNSISISESVKGNCSADSEEDRKFSQMEGAWF